MKNSPLVVVVGLFAGMFFGGTGLRAAEDIQPFAWEEMADRVKLLWNGQSIGEYVFADPKIQRPYFAQLKTPGGLAVTRNNPPVAGVDATDHDTMHPGIWLAFGDLSGHDFWRNQGRIEHLRFVERPGVRAGHLAFATESRLVTKDGDELGRLDSRYVLRSRPAGWRLDWEATFHAGAKELVFGDQEEMGFAARMATPLTEKNGGVITSSAGLKSAASTWGQAAEWCDYSGKVSDRPAGITLYFNAKQERLPECWWHNRDYGVFVANPFGRAAMKQGAKNAIRVEPGSSFRLRFHAVVHEGDGYDPAAEWKTILLDSSSPAMERVKIASNQNGFVLHPSGRAFVPWGHNYASVDLLDRVAKDPKRVEREFAEMKAAGTNVARIHPEMPRILTGPEQVNPQGLEQLRIVVRIAEQSGIYLKVTGLACYQIKDRIGWYDALDESDRWKTQAFFWKTIAGACADSPAIFAYDLVNEPAAAAKPMDGWYTGRMGDVEFCQRLTLTPGNRNGDELFRTWTARMVAAIRQSDPERLITMGMLPFPGAYRAAAENLDFVSPHLYPKTGKVEDELKLLKQFAWGKPIVIGETFPLSCGAADEREFLLQSRGIAHGWLGHWPDESPATLAELKKSGKATIHNAIWLSWVELFREVGPQMVGPLQKE